MNDELGRINLLITGHVQGVFFRASTLEQAQSLHLTGWVQNLAHGGVEIMAEGPRYGLEALMQWCQHGPPGAHVEEVQATWETYQGTFQTFKLMR